MSSIIRIPNNAHVARVTNVMTQPCVTDCLAPIDFDRE